MGWFASLFFCLFVFVLGIFTFFEGCDGNNADLVTTVITILLKCGCWKTKVLIMHTVHSVNGSQITAMLLGFRIVMHFL